MEINHGIGLDRRNLRAVYKVLLLQLFGGKLDGVFGGGKVKFSVALPPSDAIVIYITLSFFPITAHVFDQHHPQSLRKAERKPVSEYLN